MKLVIFNEPKLKTILSWILVMVFSTWLILQFPMPDVPSRQASSFMILIFKHPVASS